MSLLLFSPNSKISRIFEISMELETEPNKEEYLNELKNIFDTITDEEIIVDSKESCIMHKICEFYTTTFEVLQNMWSHPKFKPYWDNPTYLDRHGLTPVQRLAVFMAREKSPLTEWISKNMGIIPATAITLNPGTTSEQIKLLSAYKVDK